MDRSSYLLLSPGELQARSQEALGCLENCRLCARQCGAKRLTGETGQCGTGRWAWVSSAFAHHGEEDVLRGQAGSGTIFFSQCNLHCVFCQNHDISNALDGREVKPDELAGLMLFLQNQGCHNINLVTPSHSVPQFLEALVLAVEKGLNLPIVYNTGGYDRVETLKRLDGIVDIYMPDFKFWDSKTAEQLANAPDYPEVARAAFKEMHRQVGDLRIDSKGLAKRGLLVRHLVMPGLLDETEAILNWLAGEISKDTFVNVMGQYRPEHKVGNKGPDGKLMYGSLNRRPTAQEMNRAFDSARQAGLHRFG
jgi:putative pyruvate formate lyase activating enzyme